jgi:hypothetical protein
VRKYMKTIIGIVAGAALGVAVLATTAQNVRAQGTAAPQPAGKKPAKAVKDTGEYDIYNEVIKDSTSPNAAKKFLTDLDTWTQKYPETDFKDIRAMYYVQAYAANNDAGKAIDTARPLVDKGVDALKDGLDNDGYVLNLLFLTSRATAALAATGSPTPDQLATGTKAAQLLTEYGKAYFTPEKKPAAMTADQWAAGLKQIEDQAQGTLFQIALYPGASKLKTNSKDPATCAAAEAAYRTAVEQYPQSGLLAVEIAKVSLCQQATGPEKVSQGLYMYARAVSLPTGVVGGLAADDQTKFDVYLKKIYTTYHGSDEGLAQLKELAAKAPLPPADFKIKTASQISAEREEEFRTKNPQLAMWMGIKGKLADTDGQQYFETALKGTAMAGENGAKLLKGTLLEAKPACRSKELLVAIPLPDQQGSPVAEITIRLVDDQMKPLALTGKPETGGQIQFNGAPSAFTQAKEDKPFMLTLDSQKSDIEGLTLTPCAAAPAPAHKAAPAPAKKK